jgi:antirestriction protein ArdC
MVLMATTTTNRKSRRSCGTKKVRKDVYADVTARVLAALEEGTVMWHKPWSASAGTVAPINLDTDKPYRGINVFLLFFTSMEKGYGSNRWGTYKQIAERGGQVRKGEESTKIVFWNTFNKEVEKNGETKVVSIPFLREYSVFNEEQADWDPEKDRRRAIPVRAQVDPVEAAEAVLAEYLATGPKVVHGGDRAFYRPPTDTITLPNIGDFDSTDHYYSTKYHEAVHSTGHTSRLARQGIADGTFGKFGDEVYSFEELVAEMGAAMLCAIGGVDQAATVPATANYIAHWSAQLKGDNKLIVQAASQAQKAVDLVLGTKFEEEES